MMTTTKAKLFIAVMEVLEEKLKEKESSDYIKHIVGFDFPSISNNVADKLGGEESDFDKLDEDLKQKYAEWVLINDIASTDPTEDEPQEYCERLSVGAQKILDDNFDELAGTEPIQPSIPNFTREEWEVMRRSTNTYIHPLVDCIINKIDTYLNSHQPQPKSSRLDILIKWQGQQDRPSEIEWARIDNSYYWTNTHISKDVTHYRRGSGKWISLEGVEGLV